MCKYGIWGFERRGERVIDFSKYTREAIQKEMLSQVDTHIDTREGSLVQTAIGPVAWYLEGIYMLLKNLQDNAYPATAVGDSLDQIVQTRGLTRKAATAAVRKGTFDVPVPSGSLFKTINGADSQVFIVGEKISESEKALVYEMTCTDAGVSGNNYTGDLLPITAVNGLTSAILGEIITAGTEEETDDALRSRFYETFEVTSFGGNISSYRNEILSIKGVGAVQVYPAWNGGGTVLCSILRDNLRPVLPAIVQKVQKIICPLEDDGDEPTADGYGIAPIGAAVTITTGTELVLNITCDIYFVETMLNGVETYRDQIRQKIQEYLDTICKSWGDALKAHQITYAVTVYVSRIIYSILTIQDVVNVSNVKINGAAGDLQLTESAALQQVPVLGTVVINGE